MIGLVIGIVVCIKVNETRNYFETSYLLAPIELFSISVIVCTLGSFLLKLGVKKHFGNQWWTKHSSRCEDLGKVKEAEKTKLQKEYQDYLNGFNKATQDMTARFAGSSLITQMADELVIEMNEVINHADRSAHIERIHVERSFSVVPHGVRFVNWEGNGSIFL